MTGPAVSAGSPVGGPQGLPRTQRIRKRPEFVRIQDSPAKVGTPHLLLLLAPGTPGAPPRLGVVASRKVGPAVARNRAKRLVRDLVVIVRPGTSALGLAEVAAELTRAAPQVARRARGLEPR